MAAAFKDKVLTMMYPIYGFRLNDDRDDTPCCDLKRRDVTAAFFSQMSAHGPPHIYGARGWYDVERDGDGSESWLIC